MRTMAARSRIEERPQKIPTLNRRGCISLKAAGGKIGGFVRRQHPIVGLEALRCAARQVGANVERSLWYIELPIIGLLADQHPVEVH